MNIQVFQRSSLWGRFSSKSPQSDEDRLGGSNLLRFLTKLAIFEYGVFILWANLSASLFKNLSASFAIPPVVLNIIGVNDPFSIAITLALYSLFFRFP